LVRIRSLEDIAIMTTSLTFASPGASIGIPAALAALAAASVVAVLWTANGMRTSAGEPAAPEARGAAAVASPMVGTFTGEFVDGMPVYRLPPVTVVAERDAGTPGIRKDDALARPPAGAPLTRVRHAAVAPTVQDPASLGRGIVAAP
jgi:hypothetical protein